MGKLAYTLIAVSIVLAVGYSIEKKNPSSSRVATQAITDLKSDSGVSNGRTVSTSAYAVNQQATIRTPAKFDPTTQELVNGLPDLAQLLREYDNRSMKELKREIAAVQKSIEGGQLIAKANAGSLTPQETAELVLSIRKQAILYRLVFTKKFGGT